MLTWGLAPWVAQAQLASLRAPIAQVLAGKRATVGVAVLDLATGDTLSLNPGRYPMQSVYKFHLALAVLHQVDRGRLSLDQKIRVTAHDLLPNTWSPLRDKYPQANVDLPLREILAASVSLSDNNACDILFRLVGGPKKVERYLRRLGHRHVAVRATEEEMAQAWDVQFTNWSTPRAIAALLAQFHQEPILSPASRAFLWQIMTEGPTGLKRIKAGVPAGTVVAHKTGTSGTNAQGVTSAINDAGIVQLPSGEHFAIVVLVSNSQETVAVNEAIIAQVSQLVWQHLAKRPRVIGN
ncbi:MAG: class A beta-lactamase, subclass A2 [Bernardetiaceae bacterium]|nr:class A beta-lactamase, subclass A2 [Bernardetiaceae bacterium]